jgi:hypothetical protein
MAVNSATFRDSVANPSRAAGSASRTRSHAAAALASQKALDERSLSSDFLPVQAHSLDAGESILQRMDSLPWRGASRCPPNPDDEIGSLLGGPSKSASTPASEREALKMDRRIIPAIVIVATSLAVLGGRAISAQDRYSLQVPGGLAFADFRGYEDWQTVAVSHNGDKLATILGNPAMIEAYKSGIPGNGKPFPDGVRFAKIHWTAKKNESQPGEPIVPGVLHDIDFMVKDSKKFADSGGWGYAQFDYDSATETLKPGDENSTPPQEHDAKCGFACHTIVADKDYVFTAYPKR